MRLPRGSGLLLPVFSLPGRYGIGDMGPSAREFADRLAGAGQRYWQVLPPNPVSPNAAFSPYHPLSAFALNPLLVSPDLLAEEGVAGACDLPPPLPGGECIDYPAAAAGKEAFLRAVAAAAGYGRSDPGFEAFEAAHAHWLGDWALFSALRQRLGEWWPGWPAPLRDRDPAALRSAESSLSGEIAEEKFLQYLAFSQWEALRAHCAERGIRVIGDLPMFPALGSADVWVHRDLFKLGPDGLPLAVAGVPPDYYSPRGQVWGNPVYDWDTVAESGFSWWVARIEHNLRLHDVLRIDHFRGLCAYWEIPAGAADARAGRWVPVPGRELLSRLGASRLPLVAEDLGVITPDVHALREEFGIPGMRVLQFGFSGEPGNPHAPGNIVEDVVLYTGTHDNNTVLGWFCEEAGPGERELLAAALGSLPEPRDIPRAMIRLAMESPARVVVVPVQDLLSLPSRARMNRPGTTGGNWRWRLPPGLPSPADWEWLAGVAARTGRATGGR
ncbi:MAG: 4-alpha-glucanotransferase [Methanolinea sp.]|nr:4-alpha-glucanotransferase [Methanolinea sp.]